MRASWILGAVGLAFCAASSAAAAPAPDLVLFNGAVFTADPSHPSAQALAIRGDRIVAVGDTAAVKALAGPSTRQVDLGGRTVIPGLNDAHAHLSVWPADEVFVETEGYDPTWAEISAAVTAAAAKAPKGAILWGTINTTVFHDPKIDRRALDALSPDHPLILETAASHGAILNSALLKSLGLDSHTPDPAAGRFERGPDGALTGVAREYAVYGVIAQRMNAQVSRADRIASLREQLQRAARYGITTIQDMPVGMTAAETADLLGAADTPVRVRITRMSGTTPIGRDTSEQPAANPRPSPLISINGVKWVVDGVVFEGGLAPRGPSAASLSGTSGPQSYAGLPVLWPSSELQAMLRESLRNKEQLQVHVFGRPAVTAMLDAMDATGGAKVWNGRRVRFEHGDGLDPALLTRAKALGVVVSQQGTHLGLPMVDPKFGPKLAAGLQAGRMQPLKSTLAAGVPLALGSDGPMNPYLGMFVAAVDPDRPDEAITVAQAVEAYTRGSAYAEFAEGDKGTLQPGKLADIAVLSQDIFHTAPPDLPKTKSVLTLVGGKVAYHDEALKGL